MNKDFKKVRGTTTNEYELKVPKHQEGHQRLEIEEDEDKFRVYTSGHARMGIAWSETFEDLNEEGLIKVLKEYYQRTKDQVEAYDKEGRDTAAGYRRYYT